MGEGKESAQVATKHAISDLWNEAAAMDTIPLLSPVALIVTINREKHNSATIKSLVRYLSSAARKSLLA